MSDLQQAQAWLTVLTPAFTALLVIAVLGVVSIAVADYRDSNTRKEVIDVDK